MTILQKIIGSNVPRIVRLYLSLHKGLGSVKQQEYTILFNTHDLSGGASKIAKALFDDRKHKEASTFFVQHKKTADPDILNIPLDSKIPKRFKQYFAQVVQKEGWLDYEALDPLSLLKNKALQQADIVHYHNLHGGYFSYELLPILSKGKKAIWTIHDMHPLTGHCGFSMECQAWKTGCGNCPDLNIYPGIKKDRTAFLHQRKKALINQTNPVLVSPSEWLAKKLSWAFPKLRIETIPNGVNTQIFCPKSKTEARQALNLPQDAFLLVYASELATQNPYKGGEVVRELIQSQLPPNTKIITIGGNETKTSEQHLPYGYIASEHQMAQLFQASDLMVYPTKADNHPLVVMEALASGLPVLATAEAGIPEIIRDGVHGYLMPAGSGATPFLKRIHALAEEPLSTLESMGKEARSHALSFFTLQLMFERYDNLYAFLRNKIDD